MGRVGGWAVLGAIGLVLLIYTGAKYWLLDAALLALLCGYVALWAASQKGESGFSAAQLGQERPRSRVLHYARLSGLRPTKTRPVGETGFEVALLEALGSGLGLEEAVSVAAAGSEKTGV